MPVEELRARIGGVFQDYMQYELSAGENIALGDLSAFGGPFASCLGRPACRDARGPHRPAPGLRLAVARALLRDHWDLMVLDEPSAGLDAQAEHDLHAELHAHRQNRTTLLVSHRLGAIRDADLIVVLADGVITETGDPATLMAGGGTYADLFTIQAAGYQEATAHSSG